METRAFGVNRPSRMARDEFVRVFGGVYEHSPWIAETAWELGPGSGPDPGTSPEMDTARDTAEGIHRAFRTVVDRAGEEKQLALLRAHPDLAGKLAIAGGLTAASNAEQAGADLGNCTPEEFEAFRSLNEAYKDKFGFPFILAVRGFHRTEILEIFRKRVNNDPETEFAEALEQVHRIALLRLCDIE